MGEVQATLELQGTFATCHHPPAAFWRSCKTRETWVLVSQLPEWLLPPPHSWADLLYPSSIQFSPSVVSDSWRTHECSTPGLPVHHHLPEFTQTHVHWVRDAIQPSHSRSSLSPPASNPSQHQSLFQWVNSSHEVAKVLEFQL